MGKSSFSKVVSAERILSIDASRGFIMILMALDHANSFLSSGYSSEFWGGQLRQFESSAAFLLRFVTHVCAPGFFFLMGVSMIYLSESRRQQNWPDALVRRYFITRGLVIIMIHFALSLMMAVPRILQGDFGIVFNVLFILGLSMILCSFCIRLSPSLTFTLATISFLLPELLLARFFEFGQSINPIVQLILVPGPMGHHTVYYTLFPWIGFCLIGLLFGKQLYKDRRSTIARLPAMIVAGLVLFFLLRLMGGFGNLRPSVSNDWMSFLHLTKYPPSIVFSLLMLSLNFAVLYIFEKLDNFVSDKGSFLLVFGRSALFFYVVHHFIYIAMMMGGLRNLSLPRMVVFWIIGLLIAYPMCKAYSSFKRNKPSESLWRLL